MTQGNILDEVLDLYKEIENNQIEINKLVLKNREEIKNNPEFEDDYTESIESYYLYTNVN